MDAIELKSQIVNFCINNGDLQIIKKYSRYFKEGYDAYGVPQPAFAEKIAEFKSSNQLSLPLLLESAPLLIKSGKYEETSFAIVLIELFKKEFDLQTFREIEKWFDIGISNWAHSDALCSAVLPYFLIKNIVPIDLFKVWKVSPQKFQRRSVPVIFIKVLKSGYQLNILLEFINSMMMDQERVVHQGLGWFLREAWKLHKVETEDFLMLWKDRAPRLIFQYATEKMEKPERLRFKRQ